MIERFLKAKKEKPSNNQLCEEIASHICEGLKVGTVFISKHPHRILIVDVEKSSRQAFIVAVNKSGPYSGIRDTIRFEKFVWGDWVVETEVVQPKGWLYRSIDWEEISEKRKAKDLPKLLKMLNNSTPRKYV